MKKYEIINPSDKCFISADDVKIAQFCCLFVGNGRYGLKDIETKETVLQLFVFGGVDKFIEKTFGNAKDFLINNKKEIVKCLNSFEYATTRTSLNNIEAQFEWFKNEIVKIYGDETK